jgi:hypothetical protein
MVNYLFTYLYRFIILLSNLIILFQSIHYYIGQTTCIMGMTFTKKKSCQTKRNIIPKALQITVTQFFVVVDGL